ncbi:MAG: branched-chain amino acid ABC transporter permease, partial [Candidatus Rokubacteria bacterium]|nr:branched-chain amino acid ABC transporter permease [Candidatus Rokubacteria bacterium]
MKLAALLAVGVLVALPWIVSSYALTVLIFIFFYAYLGQAWNIVGGYAGQLSVGHAAFVGVGGYAAALLQEGNRDFFVSHPWLALGASVVVAGLASALLGLIVCLPTLRLRGDYFAIVTFGFAEIVRQTIRNEP